jgi:hypothetical protein
MEWDIVIHDEEGYAEIITSGLVDGEGTVDMANAIAKAMKSRRITKALIDHRNVEDVIQNISATYNRPKIFRLIGITLGIKIAEIIRPEHAGHFKFFETVCINQGYQLSVFQDKDEALIWLLA